MPATLNRRRFLQSSTATAAAAGVATLAPSVLRAARAANEQIVVGIMGVNGRGQGLADTFAAQPDVAVAYICDVDERVIGPAVEAVTKHGQKAPQAVGDFRRILDDPAVDGLVVATPDHWHAMATVHACQAGKHVFVEKPISHDIVEGDRMVAAARKHNRAVQVDTQRRSSASLKAMVEFLASGGIGKVHFARSWITSRRENIGRAADEPAPPGVDYDMWLGPAASRPFNRNHFHYRWHWFWEYGTGELGNNGVHGLDLARWGLGVDLPTSVVSSGAKHFFDDDQVTPDTQVVCYEYPGLTLLWEHRTWSPFGMNESTFGVEFHGADGVVITDGRKWWIHRPKEPKKLGVDGDITYEPQHQRNWMEAIRTGARPCADIEIGHTTTTLCHLGNISQRVGRKLSWDAARRRFPDADADANTLLGREYRGPWTLPAV
ncbi:MAG: Gfo/Idh/MocA family oxidoreductase [Planctomycetia bacterium]|nr:Gfo/Idh/MocA family oxidoreductase [Planctomycetia bacterium]